MFIELGAKVGSERGRDLQREAERERLIRLARAERQATERGVSTQHWIKRIVGWMQPVRHCTRPAQSSG